MRRPWRAPPMKRSTVALDHERQRASLARLAERVIADGMLSAIFAGLDSLAREDLYTLRNEVNRRIDTRKEP